MKTIPGKPYAIEPALIEAARHGDLVIFVGAGASMLCGSPDWKGFANEVVHELERKNVLRFLEAEQLRNLGDARRTLSIAMELAKEHEIKIDYDSILHPKIPNAKGIEFYKLLTKLRPVFVTTNYDKWLDTAGETVVATEDKDREDDELAELSISRKRYFDKEKFTPDLLLERGAVIHLHGSYEVPDSMVVSLKDYIYHYAHKNVNELIEEMFLKRTVLFVGYGLAELEILENIVRYNPYLKTKGHEPKHFILYACRSTEHVQTRFISDFFLNQCGVKVMPYEIDDNGFHEVLNVFKAWSDELVVSEPNTLDLQLTLDRYINDATPIKRKAAITLVQRHPEMRPYLLNSAKDIDWYEDLDAAGFLL